MKIKHQSLLLVASMIVNTSFCPSNQKDPNPKPYFLGVKDQYTFGFVAGLFFQDKISDSPWLIIPAAAAVCVGGIARQYGNVNQRNHVAYQTKSKSELDDEEGFLARNQYRIKGIIGDCIAASCATFVNAVFIHHLVKNATTYNLINKGDTGVAKVLTTITPRFNSLGNKVTQYHLVSAGIGMVGAYSFGGALDKKEKEDRTKNPYKWAQLDHKLGLINDID